MNVKRKMTSIIKNSSYLSDEDDDEIVQISNRNRQRILHRVLQTVTVIFRNV